VAAPIQASNTTNTDQTTALTLSVMTGARSGMPPPPLPNQATGGVPVWMLAAGGGVLLLLGLLVWSSMRGRHGR